MKVLLDYCKGGQNYLINNEPSISLALIIKQANINDVSNIIEDLKFNSLKMIPMNFTNHPSIHVCIYGIISLISIIFVLFIIFRKMQRYKKTTQLKKNQFDEFTLKPSQWTQNKTFQQSLLNSSTKLPQRSV